MNAAQQTPDIDAIMTQAQVFASAWALVGSRFDTGNEMANAEEQRTDLLHLIVAAITAAEAAEKQTEPVAHKPVARVRVRHKGYHMELSTFIAYALPEGLHDLYAAQSPAVAVPDEQTAFEHWYTDGKPHNGFARTQCGGGYLLAAVNQAWQGWQARAAIVAAMSATQTQGQPS